MQIEENNTFDEKILEGLWYITDYAVRDYIGSNPIDDDFKEVEYTLGYKLPGSYKRLMRIQNGGVLEKDHFDSKVQDCKERRYYSVDSIYGVDKSKPYSLLGDKGSRFWIEQWGYPDIGIVVAETMTAGHDMIFLDYRVCGPSGEPTVVHVNQEIDYEITQLAQNFTQFINGLISEDELPEE